MNVIISDKTVFRIQKLANKPISRGFDKTINEIFDEYEQLSDGLPKKGKTHGKKSN
jgi:hypothetical protein